MDLWYMPDSNVHGGQHGAIWGRKDPGGPHDGPMNFAIWDAITDWGSLFTNRADDLPQDIVKSRSPQIRVF